MFDTVAPFRTRAERDPARADGATRCRIIVCIALNRAPKTPSGGRRGDVCRFIVPGVLPQRFVSFRGHVFGT